MATIALPTKDRNVSNPTPPASRSCFREGADAELQPHRLCGGACGGRSARRQRPVARCGNRLGQDHRVSEYLWDLGLGVAEAMDTAQRGIGLDWTGAKELIRHALDAAKRGRA